MVQSRLYLIRHADVENPNKVLYGHLDGFQLSALGRAQAAALGDRLRAEDLKRIVSSPLARAVETSNLTATTGLLIGTVAYLAPEQVEHRGLDGRRGVAGLRAERLGTGPQARR